MCDSTETWLKLENAIFCIFCCGVFRLSEDNSKIAQILAQSPWEYEHYKVPWDSVLFCVCFIVHLYQVSSSLVDAFSSCVNVSHLLTIHIEVFAILRTFLEVSKELCSTASVIHHLAGAQRRSLLAMKHIYVSAVSCFYQQEKHSSCNQVVLCLLFYHNIK